MIETRAEHQVIFRLAAFSRSGHALTKIAGPIAPRLQEQASRKYRTAMRDAVQLS